MHLNLNIPTTWNELSEKQFANIAYQLECYKQIIIDDSNAVKLAATKLYLQIAKELLRENKYQHVLIALKEIQPKAYIKLSEFIYNKIERTKFLPSFRINNTVYYGPTIRMRNVTIAEFSFVDAAFYKWKHTQQPIWLTVLCAALYREAAAAPSEIDRRTKFIKQSVDARADIFQKLPQKTKLSIAYSYEGCRNHIESRHPFTFPKPVQLNEETPKPPKQKYISFGEIILDKIKGDPSKLETTQNLYLYDFLSIYEKDLKDLRRKKQ